MRTPCLYIPMYNIWSHVRPPVHHSFYLSVPPVHSTSLTYVARRLQINFPGTTFYVHDSCTQSSGLQIWHKSFSPVQRFTHVDAVRRPWPADLPPAGPYLFLLTRTPYRHATSTSLILVMRSTGTPPDPRSLNAPPRGAARYLAWPSTGREPHTYTEGPWVRSRNS